MAFASKDAKDAPKLPHAGHRKRLKNRFMKDPTLIPDYELLELILYWVFPRRDTKDLAKNLLSRMGSLAAVLNAPPSLLQRDKTEKALYAFHCIRETSRRLILEEILQAPLLNNTHKLKEYCATTMAYKSIEELRLFFVDKKYYLIQEDLHASGTLDNISVYPRELLKRALELNATGILMVHNHPSGDSTPSSSDITLTHHLRDSLAPFSIKILDHLIIGKHGHFSFREGGLL